jgi:hypothetical protein
MKLWSGLWIGTLPAYTQNDGEVQGCIDIFCRRMYIDRSAYNIEIRDVNYGPGGRVRAVYAVRRPVENVIDSL